jgi:hypothetical protein
MRNAAQGEVGGECWQLIEMTIAPAIFDGHVFALHGVREPYANAAPDGLNDPLLKNPSASAARAPRAATLPRRRGV